MPSYIGATKLTARLQSEIPNSLSDVARRAVSSGIDKFLTTDIVTEAKCSAGEVLLEAARKSIILSGTADPMANVLNPNSDFCVASSPKEEAYNRSSTTPPGTGWPKTAMSSA